MAVKQTVMDEAMKLDVPQIDFFQTAPQEASARCYKKINFSSGSQYLVIMAIK